MNIVVTGARAPIAADIAKALALAGHRVWASDSLVAPVSAASPHLQGYLRLPPPRTDFHGFSAQLAVACTRLSITAVIPTSEEVFWLAAAIPSLPPSVKVRTSPLPVLAELHHKGKFAKLATSLGYGAPENHVISQPSDFEQLGDPSRFVLKPIYSRFATRIMVAPTAREIELIRPTQTNPWLAQTRVKGRELSVYNVAEAGRLLLHVAYEPRFRIGVGAGLFFLPVPHDGVRIMSERLIQATGFTGQISFDVMETEHGLVALECNPRGTSGAHLAAQQPVRLAASLLGRTADENPEFLPAPRMLRLPLLLNHPAALIRAADRQLLATGQDAMTSAGIPFSAQMKAILELSWRAMRMGVDLQTASTADFEWNGEPIRG